MHNGTPRAPEAKSRGANQELQVFGGVEWGVREYEGVPILTATMEGVLHYEAASFCRVTGHRNVPDAIAYHVAPEQKIKLDISKANATIAPAYSGATWENTGPNPYRWFITREGANRLVLDSRVAGAQRIKHWLADDVMTSIEDTGGYVAPSSASTSLALPNLTALDAETLAMLGQIGQALSQTTQALLAEKAVTAHQARELEAAQSKAEFVDVFVDPAVDNTLFRVFCAQINAPERKLREHLMTKGILYKKWAGKRFSRSKKAWQDVYEYHAHASRRSWFHPVDQVLAPRLHNNQFQTTLYVTPVGKVGIKKWLERNPIDGGQ